MLPCANSRSKDRMKSVAILSIGNPLNKGQPRAGEHWIRDNKTTATILVGHLRLAHTRELLPATSPCNKTREQVPSCDLGIFAAKSNLVPANSPTNSNWFEVLGQVPATCFSKHFVWTVRGTSPCNQSLRVNCSGDKLQSCVPTHRLNGAVADNSHYTLGYRDLTTNWTDSNSNKSTWFQQQFIPT